MSCSQSNTIVVLSEADPSGPQTMIPIEGEDPRALAVSVDGTKVLAAIFESGNNTTVLGGGGAVSGTIAFPPNVVSDPVGPWAGVNPPPNDGAGFEPPIASGNSPAPRVSLIVRKNAAGQWQDDNGGDWTNLVSGAEASRSGRRPGWDLVDHDLAIIDAATNGVTYARGLMNLCMAVGVNPASGAVTVVGTDATNEVRFEPVLRGTFVRVHMATVNLAAPGSPVVTDLNPHLTYESPSVPLVQRLASVGDPRAVVWNAAGTRGYVAGMGSNNVIVIGTAGQRLATITVPEGPTGLALDEARGRLYVLSKFAGVVSVVETATDAVVGEHGFHDPTPASIKRGRKHLYDTHRNSGLGQVSCASCHVDGRMDRLAWDLGDPSGAFDPLGNNNLGQGLVGLEPGTTPTPFQPFHPMKGPMTTQTLQDIIGKEPHHWRGDRTGIEAFAAAFVKLQGGDENLDAVEMQEFEDFLATITFPPNPHRNLDNTLPGNLPLPGHFTTGRFAAAGQPLPNGSALRGLNLYRSTVRRLDGGAFACVTCHTLPTGAGTDHRLQGGVYVPIAPGPMGEHHLALVSVDGTTNVSTKVPQIRNMHEKSGFNTTQLRNTAGFGYLHDGSVDSIERFVAEPAFNVRSDQEVADLVALMLSFSGSDLPAGSVSNPLEPPGPLSKDTHAAVGTQVTLSAPPTSGQLTTINQLVGFANAGRVGLIMKGRQGGKPRGWSYQGADVWQSDIAGETTPTASLLAAATAGSERTLTVVPAGTQDRMGVDRDLDGFFDGDERAVCSDPADPTLYPGSVGSLDVNGDLFLDFFDYDEFVDAFESGDPKGDFNRDGFPDFFDFDEFVAAFEAGCP